MTNTSLLIRMGLLTVANLVAVFIFAFGLLSPLTPSYGLPSVLEVTMFAGVPIALLAACTINARSRPAKVLFALEAAMIAVIFAWLLHVQTGR